MEPAPATGSIELSSALSREQFVRLSRALLRRQKRLTVPIGLCALLIVIYLAIVFSTGSTDENSPFLPALLLVVIAAVGALVWFQPYRVWKVQEKVLATPGTVTLDSGGVHRVVPGVVDGRVPWSTFDSILDTGEMLACRMTKLSWLLLPLPADPTAAARVRSMVAEHLPGATLRPDGRVASGT